MKESSVKPRNECQEMYEDKMYTHRNRIIKNGNNLERTEKMPEDWVAIEITGEDWYINPYTGEPYSADDDNGQRLPLLESLPCLICGSHYCDCDACPSCGGNHDEDECPQNVCPLCDCIGCDMNCS